MKMKRGLEGSKVSPVSCRWEKRQLQEKAGKPSPHLTHLAQAASLQSKVDVLFPSQYRSSKWVHVGLFHLQGTEVRLGKAILDPLRIRVYR